MKRRAFHLAAAACLSLAACSGESVTGLDQAIYNATFSGPASYWISDAMGDASLVPAGEKLSMTLSQLGRDFTGTFTVADSSGTSVYQGTVKGRTTSAGGDITFVIPPTCAGVLYGSFTVSDGVLSGSAAGRDCSVSGANAAVHITFTNLARH